MRRSAVSATQLLDNAHICHCRMCQKAMGNLFAALVAAPNEALSWTRGQPAAFRSSDHVDRGFCANCGTPLYYKDLEGGRTNLTIGSLDDPAAFQPRTQMGSEARIPWFGELPTLADQGETGASGDAPWAAAIAASNRQHPHHD